ncbi:MmgE/PrpD family protein [uncultured Methanobrevibacter sp.]|uniref:MmgE/PrpD family protein n=1 Tax=uncultured Methanobrevibacter sp. TaxID=253161 RepID=UPI0025DEB19C|nr:MmgE/PrpD family protein [uncultured Methanobrevibacter sp.]
MIINQLSEFLINLKYEDIPKESIKKAKLCFIDYLAVYLRGLESENSKISIKTIYELYGGDFNSLNKGFVNGIASHSLDLDDGHRLAQLHPGTVVFSTVLAMVGDRNLDLDISGQEFFEAVIVGYEIAIALGMLVNPDHRNQGFHSTGTIGSFAAGAVASKLLGLDLEKTEHCLGLCATQSSGLLEADHAGTMGKSLHAGNAVYNGILSAFLAKNGFTGGESLIDGNEGFIKALSSSLYDRHCDEVGKLNCSQLSQFIDMNLNKFHINEVYLKKYPFCRHIHSAIDSTLVLKEDLNDLDLDLDFISSIDIETYRIASEHDNFNPRNLQDLKQSLPYAIAISLVADDLGLDSIDELVEKGLFDENADDEKVLKIREIANKIEINNNEELNKLTPEKRPSKVIIKLNDDESSDLENTTFYPLGEVENPLSYEDILDKFKTLNPKFNMNKLQIIKHMEDCSVYEVFNELSLVD